MASLLFALTVALQPGTTIVLGLIERDLTGDGRAEILRVIGVGPTSDDLDADFTIESTGATVYRFKLQPLTRTMGFGAGRRGIPAEEHRLRLIEFGRWFFAQEKFQRPAEFVDSLRASAPGRLAEIPDVIARDRQDSDSRAGRDLGGDSQVTGNDIYILAGRRCDRGDRVECCSRQIIPTLGLLLA
jgi:hypothetical protein